jgi:hypothetical protein
MGRPFRFGKMPVKVLPGAGTYKYKGGKKKEVGFLTNPQFSPVTKNGARQHRHKARLSCPERLQIAIDPIMAENSGPAISTPLCDQSNNG